MGLFTTSKKGSILSKQKDHSVSTVSISVPPTSQSENASTSTSPSPEPALTDEQRRYGSSSSSMTSASLAKSSGELGYFKQLPSDVYRATRPMLYILQSQMSRRYYEWSETQPVSQNKQGPLKWWLCQYSGNGTGTGQIPIRRLSLVGTVLYIETREDGKLEEYPLIDSESGQSNVKLHSNSLEIVTRHHRHLLLLQSSEPELLLCLQLLVTVSIFEYFSCYRAITGSLISTLGLSLPDIHLLLRSKFNYKDWCEIYIEGEGWVKAWCHVNRDSRLCARNYKADGKYQIKFYRSNKSSSPNDVASNLICYIPDSCRVEDIVFYTGNHHKPETVGDNDTAMVTRFLDGLNLYQSYWYVYVSCIRET